MVKKKIITGNAVIKNKRAEYDYIIINRYTAGIVLCGTEIKSVRAGRAGLSDTYCVIINSELWVKNMYVAEYGLASRFNHSVRRDRKLLLHKREIHNLHNDVQAKGLTIVPLQLYIAENGKAKLDIALCKGKREYDKRATLREKDDRREIARNLLKNF